ncbi:MAG: LCP family protein [Bacillota bacterium]|nr:LCP family protein [Bacillota bacterium]
MKEKNDSEVKSPSPSSGSPNPAKKPWGFTLGGWHYSVKRIIFAAVAILLALGLGIAGRFSYVVFCNQGMAFNDNSTPISTPTVAPSPASSSVTPAPSPTPTTDPYEEVATLADTSFMKKRVNVILIGVDHAEERDTWRKKYYYSDVMMVLAINFNKNKVDMISCPRDTYAKIYKVDGIYKLNSSMYWGGGLDKNGPKYVMKSVQGVLGGIPIKYYVAVDISGLKDLVDAIGGVWYDVDFTFTIQGRVLNPGFQHLNGQQVVDYCRVRRNITLSGDINRTDRQRRMLMAIFKQMKANSTLAKLPDIIKALEGAVYTNLSFEQICALVVFGSKLDENNITPNALKSSNGKLTNIFNWNFFIVDQEAKVKLLKKVYGVTVKQDIEHGWDYVELQWNMMQAQKYVEIVKAVISEDEARLPEEQKLTPEQKGLLNTKIAETEALLAQATEIINDPLNKLPNPEMAANLDTAMKALKDETDLICKPLGIKIKWFVDENPGKERLTG